MNYPCPICGKRLTPGGDVLMVDAARRLAAHLYDCHPHELTLLELALHGPPGRPGGIIGAGVPPAVF